MMSSPVSTDPELSIFFIKLWAMVNDPETNDIVSWHSADSFFIKNEKRFELELCPRVSEQCSLSHFCHTLVSCGFRRKSLGNGVGTELHHAYFRPDRYSALISIERNGTKFISTPTSSVSRRRARGKSLTNSSYGEELLKQECELLRRENTDMKLKLKTLHAANERLYHELTLFQQARSKCDEMTHGESIPQTDFVIQDQEKLSPLIRHPDDNDKSPFESIPFMDALTSLNNSNVSIQSSENMLPSEEVINVF